MPKAPTTSRSTPVETSEELIRLKEELVAHCQKQGADEAGARQCAERIINDINEGSEYHHQTYAAAPLPAGEAKELLAFARNLDKAVKKFERLNASQQAWVHQSLDMAHWFEKLSKQPTRTTNFENIQCSVDSLLSELERQKEGTEDADGLVRGPGRPRVPAVDQIALYTAYKWRKATGAYPVMTQPPDTDGGSPPTDPFFDLVFKITRLLDPQLSTQKSPRSLMERVRQLRRDDERSRKEQT